MKEEERERERKAIADPNSKSLSHGIKNLRITIRCLAVLRQFSSFLPWHVFTVPAPL